MKMRNWTIVIVLVLTAAIASYVRVSIQNSGSFDLWIEDCLSNLMSGDRTAAVLEMEKSRHASLNFTIRSHTPWETYCFSPVDETIELHRHAIWEMQVDIAISNRGPLSFVYPDPSWVYSTTNTRQEALIVRPHSSVALYSGPFRGFAVSMQQPDGKETKATLQIQFPEELTTRDQFRLNAVWADGP